MKSSSPYEICRLSYALLKSLAFNVLAQPHLMIKYDLTKVVIKYKTDEGTAYFYSLRHNFATSLDLAAKSAKTMQSLMRHFDPRLTLNIYTHMELPNMKGLQ